MLAVIGGQYGSEGKGVIVNSIAEEYDVHIRVGSPNAGHTFYWKGEKHVMQSIPCGWTNPNAKLIIGRGALINMDFLVKEIQHIEVYYPNIKDRLIIDADAGILSQRFHDQEGGINGEMHKRIGSTGEGVGPARIARINRDPSNFEFFKDVAKKYGLEDCVWVDTPKYIARLQDAGRNILLEGTQGSGLSLLHGHWPWVTSIDTNAAQICAECGIAPNRLSKTLLVCRTYPIRVAGPSGPLYKEILWEDLSQKLGVPVQEKTTVTKKIRRIGEWDIELVRNSVILNNPDSIALTFADYIDPSVAGVSQISHLSHKVYEFISKVETETGVPVSLIGTGGSNCEVVRVRGI